MLRRGNKKINSPLISKLGLRGRAGQRGKTPGLRSSPGAWFPGLGGACAIPACPADSAGRGDAERASWGGACPLRAGLLCSIPLLRVSASD